MDGRQLATLLAHVMPAPGLAPGPSGQVLGTCVDSTVNWETWLGWGLQHKRASTNLPGGIFHAGHRKHINIPGYSCRAVDSVDKRRSLVQPRHGSGCRGGFQASCHEKSICFRACSNRFPMFRQLSERCPACYSSSRTIRNQLFVPISTRACSIINCMFRSDMNNH